MDNLYRLKFVNVTLQVTDVNHTQNEYQCVNMKGTNYAAKLEIRRIMAVYVNSS